MSVLFNFYPALRPLLFSMDAEAAHHRSLTWLKTLSSCRLTGHCLRQHVAGKPVRIMGLELPNPVGLAAGLDKNGAYVDALASLGFGFIEVGTVTPRPQAGNPSPRLFRLPRSQALINRMGFNNDGLDAFLANIADSHWARQGGVLGLNIGKNATTPNEAAVDDYLIGLRAVYAHADYIVINISSPNTQGLRDLQGERQLSAMLSRLNQERERLADDHGRRVPLALKVAPDLTAEQVDAMAQVLLDQSMDGVIATNTTISRLAVEGQPHADEAGGLSGPPVHEMSLPVIARLRERLGPEVAIIGVGGIVSGQQAREKMAAGADAIQLYTGLIYRGPALISECARALADPVGV
ncbi:MAG TPA: quinone-dependent dihydroorotate dehydrogenase [Burkholderiaceae bacterium]|nr:quinone-dependent dihydroorotate dehydrogenase [Burkholderiaceae bacterium]